MPSGEAIAVQVASALIVAGDEGARACCAPLLRFPGVAAVESVPQRTAARVLFCGTSDSAQGRAIESAARRAARAAGLRVVALEDFPGNYWDLAGGEADIVVAESEASAAHYRTRLGVRCPELWVSSSPRYDELRRQVPALRNQYARRDRARRLVLWAGQPETAEAVTTLRRALPALERLRAALLFRAHPRDPGYGRGEYRWLLGAGAIEVLDVTSLPLEECIGLAPELVLTQFSSIGVEAGFHGIPALHLLYADAGAKSLYLKKGLSSPPWCAAGAAFLLQHPGGEHEMLRTALEDGAARANVIADFDKYFSARAEALPALGARLYNHGLIESTAPQGRASG